MGWRPLHHKVYTGWCFNGKQGGVLIGNRMVFTGVATLTHVYLDDVTTTVIACCCQSPAHIIWTRSLTKVHPSVNRLQNGTAEKSSRIMSNCYNPLRATTKPQINRPSIRLLVHWPLMVWLLHLVQRAAAPPSPLLAVPNVTAHPSTASVPTSYYSI